MVDDEARPWEPLFTTKPERFTEILLNQDDAARAREYERVQDLLFGEIVRFGFLNHPEQWPSLAALYRYLLDHELPLETRWEVYRHVVGMVTNSKVVSAGALTPFFLLDPDRGVASTAALDYTSLAPLRDDDPMSRPKELLQLIDDGEVRNPGAVFGALLVLGDPRVCKLLLPYRDRLSQDEAKEAAQCTTGFVHAATIEFVLAWMEGLDATTEDALFGSLASHLGLQRRHMQIPFVATGLRPFPVTSVTPSEQQAMLELIPVRHYLNSIAPRMLALERAEPETKVMPGILSLWEIGPSTLNG
jgi:hypothetical protein